MEFNELNNMYRKNNMVKSLKDGIERKFSGCMAMTIDEDGNEKGFDSCNNDLIVYQNGIFAEIVAQGIDEQAEHRRHIDNVLRTCKRLGVTSQQLLKMDYMKELKS